MVRLRVRARASARVRARVRVKSRVRVRVRVRVSPVLQVDDEDALLAHAQALAVRHGEHVGQVERLLTQPRLGERPLLQHAAHPEEAVVLRTQLGHRERVEGLVHHLEHLLAVLGILAAVAVLTVACGRRSGAGAAAHNTHMHAPDGTSATSCGRPS